jgi:hypothetical protein
MAEEGRKKFKVWNIRPRKFLSAIFAKLEEKSGSLVPVF